MDRRLRRFTESGLQAFGDGLSLLSNDQDFDVDRLLNDDDLTEVLDGDIRSKPDFANRYEMALYLMPIVRDCGLPSPLEDRGVWSWIAASWLTPLFAVSRKAKLGGPHRWLLQTNAWQNYYRHLFAGPCSIVAQHEDDPSCCEVLLTTELLQPGGFYDDAASQQRTVRSSGLLQTMGAIYLDDNGGLKPGSSGALTSPGSIRRLSRHLDRLELTYDLQSISAEALLDPNQAILPEEFRSFG